MSKRLETLQKLVDAGSNDPFAYYGLALEQKSLGMLHEALATFASLRAKFPAYLPQYLMSGSLAASLDQKEAAREFLRAGLSVAKTQANSHAEREIAQMLDSLGD
jgi:hypothetical protein